MALTPPTFVSSASTAYNTNTTPKTLNVSVNAGDLLVVTTAAEDGQATLTLTATGLTWTKQQEVDVASYTVVQVWTATAGATQSYTLSLAESDGVFTGFFGMTATVWRDHGGVGASSKTNVSSGAPSLGITTTSDNSAIVVATSDWNASDGTSRTWRTAGVAATETLYGRDSSNYTRYAAYHTDAGTAGAKTVGLSAPSGQKYSIVALEVIGTASGSIDLAPTGISSAEAFGTPALDKSTPITATGIASAETFGTVSVSKTTPITVTGISTAEAFGTASISKTTPISPSGIGTGEAFGTASISKTTPISPAGISTAEAFGTPALTVPVNVQPAGIASGEAFGTTVVSQGKTLAPAGIASGEAFGTPTLTVPVTITPTGIATAQAFGAPTISKTTPITVAGIASAEAFGNPTVALVNPTTTISPAGIASGETFGTASMVYDLTISPSGIATGQAFGTATVQTGIKIIPPASITSGEAFGTPTVTEDSWRQIIERTWWKQAVEEFQRTVGFYAEMIDSNDTWVMDLPVTSGSIDYDGEAAEQWAATLTIVGQEWVPRSPKDPLDPRSGLRCRLWWQLWKDGGWIRIPVGTYILEDPQIRDDGTTPVITIKGRDPLTLIRRNGYGSTVVAVGGLTIPDALTRIFQLVSQNTPITIESTSTVTLPAVYELTGNDPLDDITNIAAQAGLVVRTDRLGRIVCAPEPDNQDTRADWQEGPNCPVIDMDRDIDSSNMVNSVTVVSTSPEVTPPVSVTVEDTDPSSPTWVNGKWGRRSLTIRTDAAATEEGARALAYATLNGRRRPTETITVEVPGRGDLGFRDPIKLYRPASAVADTYRISKWTLPITGPAEAPPTMTVTMMTRSTT